MIWSFALSIFGIVGIYLAGKKLKAGWAVGFFAQIVWIVYAIISEQYGFILASIAYGYVHAKNWWTWRTEEKAEDS